ncbi:MAG TPA: carboxypeptidase-like regulatory domain-containing protein [Terriglobia bacterium]|nr:carboxypeptidase-like regulatory domain-containing protein [Terriglobia bacterium]
MSMRGFGKALLFVFLSSSVFAWEPAIAQDFAGYSPYAGTWRLSEVREQFTLSVDGPVVTGSINSPDGAKTPIASGRISAGAITFGVESPDGQRTITFHGILKGSDVVFTRSVAVHDGGATGEKGIFGVRGPKELSGKLIEPRGSIAGRVLDRANDAAIGNASVSVRRRNSGPPVYATVQTSADGSYIFRNLPAGDYNVTVGLSPYLLETFGQVLAPENGRFGSLAASWGIGVNAGAHFEGVVLRLTKTSAISGTIVDENGKSLANAPVVAYQRRNANGRDVLETATPVSQPTIRGTDYIMPNVVRATTDDEGRYRLEDMAPGEYYVSAVKPYLPEREMNARRRAAAFGNLGAALGLQRCDGSISAGRVEISADSLPPAEADAPLFYPGVPDAGRATTVRVPPGGDASGIDFALRPQQLGQIHVSVVRPGNAGSPAIALVAAGLRFSAQQPSVSCATENGGKAEIDGVVPGPYKLIAVVNQGGNRMVGIQDVYVEPGGGGSVTLNLRAGVDVRGQLHLDNAPRGFNPQKLTVRFTPVDSDYLLRVSLISNPNSSTVNADGSFVLRGVIPGLPYKLSYSVPNFGDAPAQFPTARYGGEPVAQTLTIENGEATLDLQFPTEAGAR